MSRGALALLPLIAACGCGDTGRKGQTLDSRPSPDLRAPAPAARLAPGRTASARLAGPAPLRERPGGRVIARLRTRTEFGSERVLAVVRRRPGWLGVLATEAGNGRVAWIAARNAQLEGQARSIDVSLSRRELVVRHRGRVESRHRVGIGGPSTPTPTGRFAVTDRLTAPRGSPYGCCILALTGRQPNLPQGWGGGDRLAIHGTTAPASVGRASSSGCLRASAATMRALMRVIPLGARVTIRR